MLTLRLWSQRYKTMLNKFSARAKVINRNSYKAQKCFHLNVYSFVSVKFWVENSCFVAISLWHFHFRVVVAFDVFIILDGNSRTRQCSIKYYVKKKIENFTRKIAKSHAKNQFWFLYSFLYSRSLSLSLYLSFSRFTLLCRVDSINYLEIFVNDMLEITTTTTKKGKQSKSQRNKFLSLQN